MKKNLIAVRPILENYILQFIEIRMATSTTASFPLFFSMLNVVIYFNYIYVYICIYVLT